MSKGLLAIGLLLVLIWGTWRAWGIAATRRRVGSALRDADATVRASALRRIGATGLRPFSDLLLSRIQEIEPNGSEADELAWLVAATQWEPPDDPRIVQLRLWARQHKQSGSPVLTAQPSAQESAHPEHATVDAGEAPQVDRDRRPSADRLPRPRVAVPPLVAAVEATLGSPILSLVFSPYDAEPAGSLT